MMDKELKPCPFCGGKPKYLSTVRKSGRIIYEIWCGNNDCDIGPEVTVWDDKEKIITAWNRRKGENEKDACD